MPRVPKPELSDYSITTQMSTQPINFAITDKTQSSELPQPIHTVSNLIELRDISLISECPNSEPLSSQFSLPTSSQIGINPFRPPQRQVTSLEREIPQAQWSHSFYIVISTPSFKAVYQTVFTEHHRF